MRNTIIFLIFILSLTHCGISKSSTQEDAKCPYLEGKDE